jgi:hypothetical protein
MKSFHGVACYCVCVCAGGCCIAREKGKKQDEADSGRASKKKELVARMNTYRDRKKSRLNQRNKLPMKVAHEHTIDKNICTVESLNLSLVHSKWPLAGFRISIAALRFLTKKNSALCF